MVKHIEIIGFFEELEAGLDRLFCDVHCVRDAVVRGDRAILRNLKAATEARPLFPQEKYWFHLFFPANNIK